MTAFRAVLILALLAACTPRGAIVVDPAAAEVGTVRPVFVGTSRGKDEETGTDYARFRNPDTRFARFDISIPPAHQPGRITYTAPNSAPDPQTDFLTTREIIYDGPSAFRADLSRELRKSPPGSREAVVFVHGFNICVHDVARQFGQLIVLGELPTCLTPVVFGWPCSKGASYFNGKRAIYDDDAVVNHFVDFLVDLKRSGCEEVHLLVHSLGAAVVSRRKTLDVSTSSWYA